MDSIHVRYKIFLSAIEYLPFAPEDDSKGSFEEIIERFLYSSHIFLKFENMQNKVPSKDFVLNYFKQGSFKVS